MYVLSNNMWFQELMRTFFFKIDEIVFGFISTIYDLLISIARTSVLSQSDILDMADRIYKLLAVFMVFKVTFSLIMYVVNPDDFSDKSKGVSKLGVNIVFSLAMLVLTPYIFNYAYQFQTIILEDNSLGTLIFGEDSAVASESPMNTAGDTMAFITLSPFFTPDLSITSIECADLINEDGNFNENCSGIEFDGTNFGDELEGDEYLVKLVDEDVLKNYIAGVSNGNLGLTFRLDMALAESGDEFIMNYRYIFSTAVGVIVVLLLITFCMDVALRSIKLAFLQLIAPIPILSYVDPKSGKDGMFKKWYQMCFKTFLSLFLRLLALYFAVYIISRIDKMVDIVDGSYQTNMFIKIFIIIGALMFAKSFTKILEGLGLKLDGGFTLNPIKKINDQTLGGKKILGAAKGLTAGAMVGTAGMLTGAGLERGIGASFGGLKAGLQDKKFDDIRKDQVTKNAQMRRARAAGSTFGERMEARASSYFGVPGRLGKIEHDRMMTQNEIDARKQQKSENNNKIAGFKREQARMKSEMAQIDAMKNRAAAQIEKGKGGQKTAEYLNAKNKYEQMKNQGIVTERRKATALELYDAEKKLAWMEYDKERYSDSEITQAINEYNDLKNNGVVVQRKVTNEDLTDAYIKYQALQKEATLEYITDALDKNNTDVTDAVIENTYANYEKTLVDKSQALRTGEELDEQSGKLQSGYDAIQRDHIGKVETENGKLDDEIAEFETRASELNAMKEDAKASQEVVHGVDSGPSNPKQIADGNPKTRNYRYNYREGGIGSGVENFESGDVNQNPVGPPPGGGHHGGPRGH